MKTIQDVAKAAGVSVATVSRVLNNSSTVTQSTRELVLSAIEKLNYQPNLLGRNLRRSETRMILILLPTISNPFYSEIVKGMEDVANKNGYTVMICSTHSDVNKEESYISLLKNRLADGVVFMAPQLAEEELTAIGKKYPVVQCCEYKESAKVSHVSIENFSAGYKAVKHLIDLGHKKIGFIGCDNDFISSKQREAAYKKALSDAGLDIDHNLIKYGDNGYKSGFNMTLELLAMDERPTAIFSITDMMAIGAIRAIKEHGLNLPDDMAVVGVDDISFASMYDPGLTTVSQPKYDLGKAAMGIILNQLRGKQSEPEYIYLENELIIRASTVK